MWASPYRYQDSMYVFTFPGNILFNKSNQRHKHLRLFNDHCYLSLPPPFSVEAQYSDQCLNHPSQNFEASKLRPANQAQQLHNLLRSNCPPDPQLLTHVSRYKNKHQGKSERRVAYEEWRGYELQSQFPLNSVCGKV